MSGRVVTFNITLDADDNRTLEACAGMLGKTVDELLIEAAGVPIADFLKRIVRDVRQAMKGAPAVYINAAVALAVAKEVKRRNGIG